MNTRVLAAVAAATLLSAPGIAAAQTLTQDPQRVKRMSAPKIKKLNPAPAEIDVLRGDFTRTFRSASAARQPQVRLQRVTFGSPRAESARRPKALLGVSQPAAESADQRALVPNANVRQAPFNAVGKMLAKFGNKVSSCTAQFVAEGILLTAAHCVQDPDTGDMAEQIVFGLGYNRGKAGAVFAGACTGVMAGFMEGQGLERNTYDIALIVMDKPQRRGIGIGLLTDYDPDQVAPVVAAGYPGAMAGGEVMQVVSGEVKLVNGDEIPENGIVALIHGVRNFTQGSSGGAWISKPSSRPGEGVNQGLAVVSFGSPQFPGVSFAAYLTSERMEEMINATKEGCGAQ